MKKYLAFAMALAMVAACFAGCGNSSSTASTTAAATTAAAGETAAAAEGTGTVKIGMSGPLTGGASAYGLAVKAGMEVAVEEINAKGGLQIEFNAQDDEADGEKAVSAYNVLKDWGMQVMAGQVTTGSALAVAPETVTDNMFNLTPSASAESLALTGPNVFQMCFTDPNQGASAAELVSTKFTGSKVGIIYDSSDDYSSGLYKGFSDKAAELGVEVVATTSYTADKLSKTHIMDIALYQLYLVRHSRFVAGRKIIINNRSKATLLQLLHYMGANITCSAGNKNIHRLLALLGNYSLQIFQELVTQVRTLQRHFYSRLQKALFIAHVITTSCKIIGIHRLFLSQNLERISQLDFIAATRLGFFQNRENFRCNYITSQNSQTGRRFFYRRLFNHIVYLKGACFFSRLAGNNAISRYLLLRHLLHT